jgi:hypothetical protein
MSSLTTFDAFLKENYGNKDRVQRLMYEDSQFLAYITKKTDVANTTGDLLIAPVKYGTPQGLAGGTSGLANAQTAAAATGGSTLAKKWQCTFGDYSAAVTISDKLMTLSASDQGAYLEAKKEEIDGLYKSWAQVFSSYLLLSKTRALGSFTISTGVCTMTYPDDIVNIAPGMLVQSSAGDGSSTGHTLLGSGSIGYVYAVNPNAGTFTVGATDSTTPGDPSGWTGTMYAFRYGDFGGTSTPAVVCDGFGDWCPAADPGGTSFNGVDRTGNIAALSGVRLTAAEIVGASTEQRIKRLVTRMAGRGFGAPDAVFLNPEKWQDVADSLESRGVREAIGKDAAFGFQKIRVAAGGALVDIYSDRFMPIGSIYALRKGAFTLFTPKSFPFIVNGDGLQMLRKATTNDYEFRLQAYPCTLAVPGFCGRTAAA